MATVASGNVTAGIPIAGVVTLTWTDTSTGVTGLVSKVLVITDPLGNVLDTVNMGAATTATYDVTSDQWLQFEMTITASSGNGTVTKAYVCISFYQSVFAPAIAALTSLETCNVFGQAQNLSLAELNKNAAIDMAQFGQAVQSNALIVYANFLVSTPYYA